MGETVHSWYKGDNLCLSVSVPAHPGSVLNLFPYV